jgi:hypothetical protein
LDRIYYKITVISSRIGKVDGTFKSIWTVWGPVLKSSFLHRFAA